MINARNKNNAVINSHSSFSTKCNEHFTKQKLLHTITIINNYSPKWRRIVVDIYRAAKRRGKYTPLFTSEQPKRNKMASRFAWIFEKEILSKNGEAVPKNTNVATKFGGTVFNLSSLIF